jgi:hypothetical protein
MTDYNSIADCNLDLDGARRQRDRYRTLARHVGALEREAGVLSVLFRAGFDEGLLREAIRVERRCCPFFALDFDPGQRLLRIRVDLPARRPALDALEFALTS